MARKKILFCKHGHEIAIVGRDSTGHCNGCKVENPKDRSEYNKEYYERTRTRRLSFAKEYRNKNRETINKYQQQYNKTHREQIRKRRKKNSDQPINTQLALLLRNRLNRAIVKNYKAGSAVRDLGCSIEFFKSYLEAKFLPDMNWDNHGRGKGKWNVDHVIPLSSFDLSNRTQFLEACHYTNLQPMWQLDNLHKGNKILVEEI